MFVDAKGAQTPPIGCACLCAPHRLHGERCGCLFGRLRLFRKLSTFYRLFVLLGAIASGGRNCQSSAQGKLLLHTVRAMLRHPWNFVLPPCVQHAALDMQPWGGASREA